MNWEKSDTWKARGRNFLVEVYHWQPEPNENKWNVYAYIYPGHPRFQRFDFSDNQWQVAGRELPFHCGLSFQQFHANERGAVHAVQVGADYNHLHDDRFNAYETKEEAQEVFDDAIKLYNFLQDEAKKWL